MSGNAELLAGAADLSAEQRRALVGRVLASETFRKAPRLRDFLSYVTGRVLEQPGVTIREQEIGAQVYHRAPDYSTSEDGIVRVEARNVRRKLDEFFATEGKSEPVVIRIPKGSYAPAFERREAPPGAAPERVAEEVSQLLWKRVALFALVAAIVLTASTLLLWRSNSELRRASGRASGAPFWSQFFANGRTTYLVAADSSFVLLQDFLARRLTLDDYLRLKPVPESFGEMGALVMSRQYTSMADLQVAARIAQVTGVPRDRLLIRFARDLGPKDFKGANSILLGAVKSNPWISLFEDRLNFSYDFDQQRFITTIRNRSPRPGEPASWVVGGKPASSGDTYALIGCVPNLAKDGWVLMIAGSHMEGTEAAGELLLDPAAMQVQVTSLGLVRAGRLQPFELVLKSSRVSGTSSASQVIAHRVMPE